MTSAVGLPLPRVTDSVVVVPPPRDSPGAWAGAPSAIEYDGRVWLAYRLRLPIGEGRGVSNVVAVSDDGVHFTEVCRVDREQLAAESLERPALVVTPDGRWRLYVSCATPQTKHWRIDLLEAARPDELPAATPTTVLPGDARHGWKDPVVLRHDNRWHLWASVHPLERWDDADRMTTEHAESDDGVHWSHVGRALAPRDGQWDARGVRVTSVVVDAGSTTASYDGRARAVDNYDEVTGRARGSISDGRFSAFVADDGPPVRSPEGAGLRYLSVLRRPDGPWRLYYELTRADGAHELRTEAVR